MLSPLIYVWFLGFVYFYTIANSQLLLLAHGGVMLTAKSQVVDSEILISILIKVICTPIRLCTFLEGECRLSPCFMSSRSITAFTATNTLVSLYKTRPLDVDFKELLCKILLDLVALSTANNFYVQSLVTFFLFSLFLKKIIKTTTKKNPHQYVMIQKDFW